MDIIEINNPKKKLAFSSTMISEELRLKRSHIEKIDSNLLSKQKVDLVIEEILANQAKAFQKELDEIEKANSNLEKEIRDLEAKQKENSGEEITKKQKKILMEEHEKNLLIKLKELEKFNADRILKEEEFQLRKFESHLLKLEEIMLLEGLSREEEEILIQTLENEFASKFNHLLMEREEIWNQKKAQIDFQTHNYFLEKKLEYRKELDNFIEEEREVWEEEKRQKLKILGKLHSFKDQKTEIFRGGTKMAEEIRVLEDLKKDLEDYQKEKVKILEEIKEKEIELEDIGLIEEEIQRKIALKYQEVGSKVNNSVIMEKNQKIGTMVDNSLRSDFAADESKIYFSSHNSISETSSFLEPIQTGKFRERTTTNSKDSPKRKGNFQNEGEDEIMEFSSNNEEEVDFELSSEGGTERTSEKNGY